ncbi:MAG: caspase family protein [Chitinophagaceae bacterium]|nr:caspase family protein [Chitinophagaceae bacterium]
MSIKYLLTGLFIFFSSFSFSQPSVYEFDYYFDVDSVREHYNAFLVRNDDGTGFIRVRYIDGETGKPVIVHMQMQEHYLGDEDENDSRKTDSSILVFEGIDPKVITGGPGIQYDPDLFWFEWNKQTGYYEPWAVISEGADPKDDVEGVIADMRLLNQEDLTKERVLEYFTEKDEFYVNLFETTVRALTPEQKKSRLHLLIVANTDDISIGTTCVVDKDATYKTFSQLAEFLEIQFVPKVIFGKEFSKVNVDNAINDLRPGPGDIVVFYYSGHGFANVKDGYTFPYLDLRDKTYQTYGGAYTLNIEDIYKRIKAKGARLNLVFSDCCNADPTQTTLVSSDGASTRSSSIGWSMENCRALFMNPKPLSVLMTAASKGELSAGNSTGGIFTFNFRESLEKFIGPFYFNSSWNTILTAAKSQTISKAKRTWCRQPDNSKKVCVQNPVFKME